MTTYADADCLDQDLYDFIPAQVVIQRETTILYSLEPIGVGTPFVESLSSYLARLAAAHMLSVSLLLRHLIAHYLPRRNHNLRKAIGFQGIVGKMNGAGQDASDFVGVLQKLTGRSDLHSLTMLPLSMLLSNDKLLSDISKWCPYCFEEQRMAGITIHQPLLWSLQDFKKCPAHNSELTKACPHCNLGSPIIASRTVNGYCHQCKAWLGSMAEGISTEAPPDNDFFVRLFEWHNTVGYMREQASLPSLLEYLIGKKLKDTYLPELNRKIYLERDMVGKLRSGQLPPTVGAVFWISKLFSIDPFDVLTMSGEEMERKDIEELAKVDPSLFTRVEIYWPQLRALLKDVATGKASSMRVEDIAKVYKCQVEEITSRYPELCSEVAKRYSRMMR